ncbi:DNA-binding transcriptional regulator, LysR family [Paenibacillus sp. UNC496MF]|uniref:LysR family transcriptional regulator n=1 Tax=Paenibacillus sp. UNC496MF TaxID=1502753 RepID=UPI0008EAAAC0|nr:LysR family transcriptional regulator [Paenibacillus sp. UNC496MF]SFJ36983.1 DNA-binding transcriptional regulator, LysR family [Paenibacillus sp. UNC496MF]
MELLQLHYFLAVARSEHVTEAARRLHVTQSSLSKTIQRLEDDLGVQLFDRIGRRLQLNDYGRRYLRRVERALFELDQGRLELNDLSSPDHGTLELGVTSASVLHYILRNFRQKRPHIQFHVQMLTTQEMIALLERGEVDYCLSSPPIERDDIECRIVFIDPILVAVPRGHRLADRGSVALAELREEWFVGVKAGYGTRDLMDEVCRSVGFAPHYVYEGDEPARLVNLVEAEIGIAFIPSTARNDRAQIKYLQIETHEVVREIALLWHKSRYISPAAREFREVVFDYFAALKGQTN